MAPKARNKARAAKSKRAGAPPAAQKGLDRRREWRFALPLPVRVEGTLPWGLSLKETATIENISCKGAFFCLDSGVSVGSKLNIVIDIPEEVGGGRKLKLLLGGITVRPEESPKRGKRQGVAVRFHQDYQLLPAEDSD